MKKAKNKQNFTPIVIFVVLVFLVVAGGVAAWKAGFLDRFLEKKTVTPQKEQEEIIYPATPEEVTENFFQWYIDCLDKILGTPEQEEDCSWKKSQYVSEKLVENIEEMRAKKLAEGIGIAGGADPILCAQDLPTGVSASKADIRGETASMILTEEYYGSFPELEVELELFDNQWKITDVLCPPPLTPEDVTKEFYAWYINCQGGEVEGLSLAGYCPFEKEYSGSELIEKIEELGYISSELVKKIEWTPGADPILCAQDLPPTITVDKADIVGENASVTVTEEFIPPVVVKVGLRLSEFRFWEIVNITCPR